MEERVEDEEDCRASYRRRMNALLALFVLVLLSAPVALVYRKLHRLEKIVPDEGEGFRPIASISGIARDTPRVKPAEVKVEPKPAPPPPESVLASMVSFISPARQTREESSIAVEKKAPERKKISTVYARAVKVDKKKRAVVKAKPAKKSAEPPLIFARVDNIYDLDFPPPQQLKAAVDPTLKPPPAPTVAPSSSPRVHRALEPVAEPDPVDLAPARVRTSESAKSAVIVERVPSNDR